MSKTVKGSTLQAMLEDVAQDFISALELKQEALAKSEQLRKDAPPPKEEDSAPEEGSESKPDASASPEASDAPPAAPEASDAPVAAPDASPSPDAGAPAPDAGMGDPAADQALDPAALQAEYAKLSPEELDMHLQAAMAAKQALEGAAAPAPDAGAPAPAPAAPAPAAPAPEMKSEAPAAKGDGSGKIEMAKSEDLSKALSELEELKKLAKTQSEEIAALQAGIQKAVNTPDRKAVTAVSHVTREVNAGAASKEWTREGIHSHLKTLSASGKLAKSDRDLINDFYCGVVKIDKLAHLFEGK